METLKEARQYLKENYEKGCKCPLCKQNVKLYKRKLNSGMAIFLMGLYWLHKNDKLQGGFYRNSMVLEYRNIVASSLDYSVLKHFGLIEERINAENNKKNSGYWRLTEKGFSFVKGEITVPMRVHLYNNEVQGFSEEHTTIQQALGDNFDYDELMNS